MSRWSRHLEALTQAISGMGGRDVHDAATGQDILEREAPETVTASVDAAEPDRHSASVEQALVRGMEVTLGDLESTEHGWMYRGNPVMVYAVDVAAVEDQQVRKEFFHRVHLASCCGALEDPAQVVWIGTAREALAAPGLSGTPHACEYCLTKVNHRGFRGLGPRDRTRVADGFSFHWHVSQYAQEFFSSEEAHFWAPGKSVQVVGDVEPEAADHGTCGFCEWPVPAGHDWFVPVERGAALGLSMDACILCAQQQAMGVLTLPETSALAASQARFDTKQEHPAMSAHDAETETERDWSRVRRQLPLSWHPLCEQLERKLSAPVLFHRFTGYEGVAVLAWPEHRRGIVATEEERARLPEGWDFWTMRSVLGSLG
ncbi:hypothetical protein JF535_06135 [Microbulbifer salipaludis]|uniref:Uncharacterized protein n=1 Tax=Microbulbifer salipaludis TaxID=187980 RepID=A0ABS3E550_9GAMM|nr:hypothetical protein [Microbulbifer salipaludis]MBN8430432.1 hypothetical protein [Microbulbifer salipaludis]